MLDEDILLEIKRRYSKEDAVKIYALEVGMLISENQELQDCNKDILNKVEQLKNANKELCKQNKSLLKSLAANEASQILIAELERVRKKLNRTELNNKVLIHQLVVKSGHITKEEADNWLAKLSQS